MYGDHLAPGAPIIQMIGDFREQHFLSVMSDDHEPIDPELPCLVVHDVHDKFTLASNIYALEKKGVDQLRAAFDRTAQLYKPSPESESAAAIAMQVRVGGTSRHDFMSLEFSQNL